jgi:hypothetical protein
MVDLHIDVETTVAQPQLSNETAGVQSPRQSFELPANPFSPPASVISFSSYATSGVTPRSALFNIGASSASGRPNISDSASPVQSGSRLRDASHAPPSRPLTALTTALSLTTDAQSKRMDSTMLSATGPISKTWLDDKKRDPYQWIAYFLTYFVILIGFVLSGVLCVLGWNSVPIMKDNLCLVMEDNFDGSQLSQNWLREVQMDGFG